MSLRVLWRVKTTQGIMRAGYTAYSHWCDKCRLFITESALPRVSVCLRAFMSKTKGRMFPPNPPSPPHPTFFDGCTVVEVCYISISVASSSIFPSAFECFACLGGPGQTFGQNSPFSQVLDALGFSRGTHSSSSFLLQHIWRALSQLSPQPTLSKWRRLLQNVGRVTLFTLVVTGGGFYYVAHKERHPGQQLPHDPSKKTLVVLGSGWGATSFLKNLNTADYNVVRNHITRVHSKPSQANILGCHQSTKLLFIHSATT